MGNNSSSAVSHPQVQNIHPLWLRISHWLNVLAMFIMVTSGWRIYNASPLFNFTISDNLTLGGWLAGALQWHFAGMWLFAANALFYVLMNIITGRWYKKFWPLNPILACKEIVEALQGKLKHNDLSHYNMVQRFAYLGVLFLGLLSLLSGLVLWKSVQFPLLRELLGGYEIARYIHFIAMVGAILFLIIHVVMVALVPKTLLLMLRGR